MLLHAETDTRSRNHILATLPQVEYEHLVPHLRRVNLPLAKVLYKEGDAIDRVYFVEKGVTSMVLTTREGVEVEVGLVGPEGLVGLGGLIPDSKSLGKMAMQMGGNGWQMPASVLRDEFKRGGVLQDLVLQFNQAFAIMASQTALCNRLHTVEERLSRWLLQVHDRVRKDDLELTQEFLSQMLGSRRAGVTVAAGALKKAGFIDYNRGSITILDREGLENAACECYGVAKDLFRRGIG